MIPQFPEGNDDWRSRKEFYQSLINRITLASNTHIGWYTHKNPYGCWICDLLMLVQTLVNYIDGKD